MTDIYTKPIFPQAHLDQMRMDARSFEMARPPQDVSWRFDGMWNGDAAESAFVARQLESLRPGVYKIEFPELIGSQLCSINTEDDTGAEFITFTVVNQVGQVLVSRDMTAATPMVQVLTSQSSVPIFSMRLGYQYSLQEARAAILAKRPLVADQAMACREDMERKLDDIIFVGESTIGCLGLLNQSAASTYTPIVGQSGLFTFASKSADEVLKDLNGAPSQVVSTTKEIERPDTALFPTTISEYLTATRVGDGTSQSIMNYWMANTKHIKKVFSTYKSETSGTSSTPRTVFYRNDSTRLEYAVPQPFEQLPPQANGLMVTTVTHLRTAGVILKRPGSMIYLDKQ